MTCSKESGHFDAQSFLAGMALVAVIGGICLMAIFEPNNTVVRLAKLPETCRDGQQVLMTTAPTSELYVCESHWVRR